MSRNRSKKHKEDTRGQIESLQRKIAKLKKEIEKQDKRQKIRLASRRTDKLVPRPPGRAGRDWSLRERMGLIDNKRKYDYIRSKVHDHVVEILDETKRISAQDDLAVCEVVALVENDFPELKKFHNGWLIRELARQYLSNRISYRLKIEKDIGLGAGERNRGYKKIQNLVKDAHRSLATRTQRDDDSDIDDSESDEWAGMEARKPEATEREKETKEREAREALQREKVARERMQREDRGAREALQIAARTRERELTERMLMTAVRWDSDGLRIELTKPWAFQSSSRLNERA